MHYQVRWTASGPQRADTARSALRVGTPARGGRPRAGEPIEPGEPSNRWPWVALALGVLIVVLAAAFFFFNRARTVNVTVEGTPTVNAIAKVVSPVPPTVVPPTLPASATLAPTATALPSATPPPPTPTSPPAPTERLSPTQ